MAFGLKIKSLQLFSKKRWSNTERRFKSARWTTQCIRTINLTSHPSTPFVRSRWGLIKIGRISSKMWYEQSHWGLKVVREITLVSSNTLIKNESLLPSSLVQAIWMFSLLYLKTRELSKIEVAHHQRWISLTLSKTPQQIYNFSRIWHQWTRIEEALSICWKDNPAGSKTKLNSLMTMMQVIRSCQLVRHVPN